MPPFSTQLIVDEHLHGVRVDSFLVRHFRNYTSFRIQRMVHARQVCVDGVPVAIGHRVLTGQEVSVRLVEPPDKLLEPEPLPLDVIFEDPWILVVNKPAGQIAHPVSKHQTGTLANAVQHHLDQYTSHKGLLRPGIVHRLDRETSGVIVLTKDYRSHRELSIQFQQKQISKTYLALAAGIVTADHQTVDLPIGRVPGGEGILMSAKPNARDAKPAITEFAVLERFQSATLVRAIPHTGRSHQIRVHLAELGHPLVGERFYTEFGTIKSTDDQNAIQSNSHTLGRHALHAESIKFQHPILRQPLEFQAPLPADIEAAIGQQRLAKSTSP